jgi:hypothetical protein
MRFALAAGNTVDEARAMLALSQGSVPETKRWMA